MKRVTNLVIGFVAGVLLLGIIGWSMMPGMMLKEYSSPFTVEETVAMIEQNAVDAGWVVASTKNLHKSVKKHGGFDLEPVVLVNLCQAEHAYNILREDDNTVVSVMMPCTISVYRKSDGNTYVGTMNAGLLGKMFGGTVARVMGGDVARDQQSFIEFVN